MIQSPNVHTFGTYSRRLAIYMPGNYFNVNDIFQVKVTWNIGTTIFPVYMV